jgi:phosphomannomutase
MVKVAPKARRSTGRMRRLDVIGDYLEFLQPYKKGIGYLRLVSDCSNGAAAYGFGRLVADLPIRHSIINDVADGRFPQHGPNPLELQNLSQVREKVLTEHADLGVCFDGDGDRLIFSDERGQPVAADRITALLGLFFYKHHPDTVRVHSKVLCDIRSSRSVAEYLLTLGATPLPCWLS